MAKAETSVATPERAQAVKAALDATDELDMLAAALRGFSDHLAHVDGATDFECNYPKLCAPQCDAIVAAVREALAPLEVRNG